MAEYIEREAALSAVDETYLDYFSVVQAAVLNIPAADVAPVVHGRWIEDSDYLKCPECSVMVMWDFAFFDEIGNWNYCPNCGAKMDGGENG